MYLGSANSTDSGHTLHHNNYNTHIQSVMYVRQKPNGGDQEGNIRAGGYVTGRTVYGKAARGGGWGGGGGGGGGGEGGGGGQTRYAV